MAKSVSIVITAYNRANLLAITLQSMRDQQFKDYEIIVVQDYDGNEKTSLGVAAEGATAKVCDYFGVEKFIQRKRPPKATYSNPSIPNNVGLRVAEGEIILIQNGECRHVSNEVIATLRDNVVRTNGAVFAAVRSLDMGGLASMWYSHPVERTKPYFFCGALPAKVVQELRGFDEDFTEVGYDDDDFGVRLEHNKVPITYLYPETAYVEHMWHPSSYTNMPTNLELFQNKTTAMVAGTITATRNLDRDWGVA